MRELFVAAARGKIPAAEVLAARTDVTLAAFAAAATRGLPRDVSSFTGRRAELMQLLGAVDSLAADGGVALWPCADIHTTIARRSLAGSLAVRPIRCNRRPSPS